MGLLRVPSIKRFRFCRVPPYTRRTGKKILALRPANFFLGIFVVYSVAPGLADPGLADPPILGRLQTTYPFVLVNVVGDEDRVKTK